MTQNLKKTLTNGSGDSFSLSPKLIKAIDQETVKKTGAKLLTNDQFRNCLVNAGLVGGVFSAFESCLSGEYRKAVLALGSGLVGLCFVSGMVMPALGVTAATLIAAALVKNKKAQPLLVKGDKQCNR